MKKETRNAKHATVHRAVHLRVRNLRGEELRLVLEITDVPHIARAQTRHRPARQVTIHVVSAPVPVAFDAAPRAVRGAIHGTRHTPVMSWTAPDPQTLVCTRGDLNRSGTYPFFIYADGDETRKGRFPFSAASLGYDRLEKRWTRP
jgi:hypothetical protein